MDEWHGWTGQTVWDDAGLGTTVLDEWMSGTAVWDVYCVDWALLCGMMDE